jgi:hypothetical protein
MNIDKHIILEKYLRLAVGGIKGCIIKSDHFNFRCNVCGDGENETNKRGHLRVTQSRKNYENFWSYKCFNEGCKAEEHAWPGENWLKFTSPYLYQDFLKEAFGRIKPDPSTEKKKELIRKEQEKNRLENIRKKNLALRKEKNAVQYFLPIKSKSKKYRALLDSAIELCISRKLPEHVWTRWFVSTHGIYKDRLIIPFYDENDKVYYYQARDLVGNMPKYLNRIQNKDKSLYNIHKINKDKPIVILEGVIDCLYVENSIAMLGLSFTEYTIGTLKDLDVHYMLDNDKAGKDKSKKFLKEGKSIFLWNRWKYKDCKDINEIVVKYNISNFTYDELQTYFTTDIYDKLYLEM